MPPSLPAPVLTIAPGALKDLDGSDHLSGLWFVFTKCKTSLHDGRRLENISWRLWYRELASLSSYRPLTPDSPSQPATKQKPVTFSSSKRRTGSTSSLPGGSSPHQPIGRVIFEMLPGSSPETTKVLNSKLKLPPTVASIREADTLSISIVPPKAEPSASSSDSSPGISLPFTRSRPQPQTNTHSSPSLSSTSNSNHSSGATGPLVVVVNPTPNPTPHPTPPATPVFPAAVFPTSGESIPNVAAEVLASAAQAPSSQPSLSRPSAKFLTPVMVPTISQTPPRHLIPSSLQPPSPSNDSASSVSGSPFTAVTDTSANTTSTTPDSMLKSMDAKKFASGLTHDHDRSCSPTTSQNNGYTSTVYPYQPHMDGHLHGSGSDPANTSHKPPFALNSTGLVPYSNQSILSQSSRHQSLYSADPPLQSKLPSSHLYPQSSHPYQSQSHSQHSHSRPKSQAKPPEQSYAHAAHPHGPYPSHHPVSKIRDETSASGTVSPDASASSLNKDDTRIGVIQGATTGGMGGVIGTAKSKSNANSKPTSNSATSSSTSTSNPDLRLRNRNQGLPNALYNGVNGGMNVQHQKSGVTKHRDGLGHAYGPGHGGGGAGGGHGDKSQGQSQIQGGHSSSSRRQSMDSEMSVSWSGSESDGEGSRERLGQGDKDKDKPTGSPSVNSPGLSSVGGSGSASASGGSRGGRTRSRSRARSERHSGLMMMSASAKNRKKASVGDPVGKKRLGCGTTGKNATANSSPSASQAQGQGNGHGLGEVKLGIDNQARVEGKEKEKEGKQPLSAATLTYLTSGTSGSRGPAQGQTQVVETEKKREREQTVTKKSMQRMLANLESVIADESSSSGNNILSSSPAEMYHVFAAAPGPTKTTSGITSAAAFAPAVAPAPYHQMSSRLAPAATTSTAAAPAPPSGTRPKGMFNIGSHSSDGDQSKSGYSVGDSTSTGFDSAGSDSRRISNESPRSSGEILPVVDEAPQPSSGSPQKSATRANSRIEPSATIMPPVASGGEKEKGKKMMEGASKSGSRSQSRRSSAASKDRNKDIPSTDAPKQVQGQAPYPSASTSIAAQQQPSQTLLRVNTLPAMVNGVPELTSDEAMAAATAFVEQLQQQQKNPRKVVITTDNDDDDDDDDDDDTLDDGEERPVIEGDDDDSDFVTEESGEEGGEEEGEWTSDESDGDEIVVGRKNRGKAGDTRATTAAAGQEKKNQEQGPTQAQAQAQQQQQPVAGRLGLQRPPIHSRHLSQPNVPTIAGVAKAEQQAQLQLEYEEQQRQLRLDQLRLAQQQQQLQQLQQVRAPGIQRSSSRRGRDREKEEIRRQQEDIKIREVVLEAQRQRDMFAKVPERSYSNLTRTKSGLSQLMNPDPQLIPSAQGKLVQQQQPVKGGISMMAPPKDGQGQGQQPQGQQRQQVKDAPTTVRSPPSRMSALKPSKSSVALPVAAQVTAASVKDSVLVKGKEKERVLENVGSGSKYRPKGRPQDQEMETDSEDEGQTAMHGSVAVKERLERFLKTSSAGSSKQQQPQQNQPSKQQPRRPPSLRQTQTEAAVSNQPASPTVLPIQRSQSQIIQPLGYPYNLPPVPPSSPRTTRQRMLREEMSESVRQNLLWHRQLSKAAVLGPRRRSSENNGLAPLTSISTVPPLVRLTKKKTPLDSPAGEQGGQEANSAEGVAMTFHDRKVPMTRTRSWAGGGR
ncbi:hypothetical protein D9758_008333 [Tetrapyrgos nigripes]|uniref:Nitrogen regulatory protein areA GATA-like domain-containing protein n=1 Tax=Tetrapyrgos nigripes TaxID=182062 RepID=A0A8H5LN29_9AGAR|nr:hypothetical protein D9758_008333 [Tetrapyrgos nigripes]